MRSTHSASLRKQADKKLRCNSDIAENKYNQVWMKIDKAANK